MLRALRSRMADRLAGMAKANNSASRKMQIIMGLVMGPATLLGKAKAQIEIAKMLAETPTKIATQIALNSLDRNPLPINTCQKPHAIKPYRSLLYLTQNRKRATPITETRIKATLADRMQTPIPTLAARIEAAAEVDR